MNSNVNNFANIEVAEREVKKKKMKVRCRPSVDELIAIEEEKERAQIEKLSKLKTLKQKEEEKKAKLKALKDANKKREIEIQTAADAISGNEKGQAQSIALDPIITNGSPTDTVLANQFDKTM